MNVDQYLRQHVLPEYRTVMALARQILLETAPKAEEVMRYGMPCYRQNAIFAYLNASKTGVTVSFVHGVEIVDKYGLLKGKAKWARFVKLKRVEDVNQVALMYYVRQAVKLDTKRA